MQTVGAFEAKTKLSELLGRVENGETIVISRHGKAIARLVPENSISKRMSVAEAIAELAEFRKNHRISQSEMRAFIEEGRKY